MSFLSHRTRRLRMDDRGEPFRPGEGSRVQRCRSRNDIRSVSFPVTDQNLVDPRRFRLGNGHYVRAMDFCFLGHSMPNAEI
jgi:hypothetical protein